MKKIFLVIFIVAGVFAVVSAAVFYHNNLRGVWPVVKNPPQKIEDIIPSTENVETEDVQKNAPPINDTGMPLELPDGFSVSIFAKDLPGSRVIIFDKDGNIWLSQTSVGIITFIEIKDGKATSQKAVFSDLKKPHGLAFDPEDPSVLYFAEEDKISRVKINPLGTPEKIIDLPGGGSHFTRTIGFGPDGRLYVSIGSSCNVCDEKDNRRAKIFSMNKDGSDFKEFARGLRNAVFFTWHPVTQKMWTTEMGRDLIGDNIPPDEINIVEQGKNYGWPVCYGKNVLDTNFHKNDHAHIRLDCSEPFEVPSYIDIQAHSAPLGLAFIPEQGWPKEYQNNLIVAYHGSWNRSVPTGYKLVRYKLDRQGNFIGTAAAEDFITGWLTDKNEALGRPVDIAIRPDGIMYVSDDKAGVIYQIKYAGKLNGEKQPADNSACRKTGCSGQICSDEDVLTSCEFKPEYECYKNASCERQSSGQCGFTPTKELQECLEKNEAGAEENPV